MNACLLAIFETRRKSNYILCGQSKEATCEDYTRGDISTGSSITPEVEDVTFLTPIQKGFERDGKVELFFFVCVNT